MKIVITGSIAYDYLMFFPGRFREHLLADQLHTISVSFLVDSMRRQRGGIAANIAYTMALLGGRPTIMATAGQDFGEYRTWLEKQGIDTSGVVVIEDEYCASFFVNTDEEQNQIASFYTGAMAHANELTFARYAPDANLVIISPNDPAAMGAYTLECKQLAIPYVYDPSQQVIRLTAADLLAGLTGCALLTVNEYELSMIQEKTGLKEADILTRAGGLLVTRGKFGSTILVEDRIYDIPAVSPREIVEPTGAGDAFRGGLLRGIQLGLPWDVAGRMGALAATYCLENFGPQGHHFTPAEFITRYREHFDDAGALDILSH
ncbi:MAG: carbohydrate kinase family protein [Chloroflexi bacterium]|nr:carbohydrate kinase family protein [Chloroflexota bacterium]MCI0577083.1 carbohydrate kinase family protein [Chloroflexota bacterium]MCI0650151.1 carbohydrate kinase family protein [Chloroflexota bacterium]MCI0728006.1 carbohydrate kinase family protein [Chloroflexota bacterium]